MHRQPRLISRGLVPSLAAMLAVILLGGPAGAQLPASWGDLIIIGGGFSYYNDPVWDRIESTRLAGKPIGVFGTASYEPGPTGRGVRDDFNAKYGSGTAVYIDITEDNNLAEDPATVATIEGCGGFYFTGGDQRRVPRAFYRTNGEPTPALEAVWAVHRAGGCVAGSSAGAAIMTDPMISGGGSSEALRYGAVPQGSSPGVELGRGLDFLPDAMVDQHHLSRGRLGRLIGATVGAGVPFGYGIDDNTALAIDCAGGWADVLGAMGVFVIDVRNHRQHADYTRSGLVLHYIDRGDRINLNTGEVEIFDKTEIENPAAGNREIESTDIWDDYEAWRLITEMADAADSVMARGRDDNFDVLFRQSEQTRAHRGAPHTYDNTRRAWTILNIMVATVPHGEPDFPTDARAAHFSLYE